MVAAVPFPLDFLGSTAWDVVGPVASGGAGLLRPLPGMMMAGGARGTRRCAEAEEAGRSEERALSRYQLIKHGASDGDVLIRERSATCYFLLL